VQSKFKSTSKFKVQSSKWLFAQGPVRRDGRWDVKMEMQMAGMTMPPQTLTQCVTKEEAADPQKGMPKHAENSLSCSAVSALNVVLFYRPRATWATVFSTSRR
jgi:hypothetical protein